MNLDHKDKVIVSMYARNPHVSQEEIAGVIGLSQPSVATRIRKLKEMGALETHTGINPLKMGMYMAKVDVVSTDPFKVMKMLKDCPFFANGFTLSGKHNLCMYFISDDIGRLESMVNNHIRPHESVSDVNFNIVISSEKELVIPLHLANADSTERTCGVLMKCEDCSYFLSKKCSGCPLEEKGD